MAESGFELSWPADSRAQDLNHCKGKTKETHKWMDKINSGPKHDIYILGIQVQDFLSMSTSPSDIKAPNAPSQQISGEFSREGVGKHAFHHFKDS